MNYIFKVPSTIDYKDSGIMGVSRKGYWRFNPPPI